MTTVSVQFDPPSLLAYERALAPVIANMGLTLTPEFTATNYLREQMGNWFEEQTAEGWDELAANCISYTQDGWGGICGAEFHFDDADKAMLFKLTFGGEA